MNTHRTPIIQSSKAIGGYLLAAEARHLSVNTLRDYTTTFKRFQDFLGEDLPISKITPDDARSFDYGDGEAVPDSGAGGPG